MLVTFLSAIEDWVREIIRGVVSDAVSCLHAGVICDFPFNVVDRLIEDGDMLAHPSAIRQFPVGVLQGLQKLRGNG